MNTPTPFPEDYYDDSYENEACNVSGSVKFGQIFNPVFFSLVVILSVFGNSLVIMILVKYENIKSITNAFILNLAISDLIFTAGLPFWVYYHMNGTWTLGEVACKSVNFVFYIGFYSSGFLLIIMTIHRYIAVVSPLSDIVSTKGLYCILAPIFIWLVSIVVAVPYFIFTKVNDDGFCGYIADSPISFWGIYQQIALFILTSLVFIFCYVQIIWRLLRPTGQRRKSKTLKVIFTLMVVFFLGWAPYNVVIFLKSRAPVGDDVCQTYSTLEYALNICRLGAFSHCCLNPVFYVFVGVKFKNHLMRFVKIVGHNSSKQNRSSVRSRQSRMTITSITSGEEMSL
ncbi:chemokine XC receptor 1-like [Boleophthalmus pectinirostris]|uniref:chemokine XC receptor 1-like n=1 Tax=Boleophthalmus pectinirostris TaxID=150288 RepID=UPI00242B8896|nr:chemokine XC receptor 1-like [Boleophthalmus pectinirostris]